MPFKHFKNLADSKLKFGFFMFTKLPSAWLCGVRLRAIDEHKAVVTVPYKWLSQNPFKSIYFACQAMAAELSTGVLAMGHIYGRKPAVSMLVTSMQAVYTKKATGKIVFTCNDGNAISNAIEQAVATGQGQSVMATSTGTNANGDTVSVFSIEWSFKAKAQ